MVKKKGQNLQKGMESEGIQPCSSSMIKGI